MAQILVRQLDDAVVEALKAQAKANARSTEAEVREILSEAVRPRRVLLKLACIAAGKSDTSLETAEQIVAHVRALRDEWDK